MEETKVNCINCETKFDASFRFCPHCGQKTDDKLTLKVLFHNTVSNYFCVDARFHKSFFPLLFRPGFLPKRFVEGKRNTYLHPAQTYLFISLIFFFLFSFESKEQQMALEKNMGPDLTESGQAMEAKKAMDSIKTKDFSAENMTKKSGPMFSIIHTTSENNSSETDAVGNKIDSLKEAGAPKKEIFQAMGMSADAGNFEQQVFSQLLKFRERNGQGLLQTFYGTFPIAMFILMPIFAFLLKLFYLKKGTFTKHMVFSFYFFSFLFVVFSILVILSFIWNLPAWLISSVLLSTFFYLFFGMKNFYSESYLLSFLKSGSVSFLFLMFVIPITLGAMAFATFMLY